MRLRLPPGIRRIRSDEELTIVEHLGELRRRVAVSAIAVVLAFIAAYLLRDLLLDVLRRPLPDDADRLITLSPTEPLFTVLKVCFGAAVLAALPLWLYQLYAYLIPAVSDQSRRALLTVVAGVSGLFAAGVAFGYFVVLPIALPFLLGFGDGAFDTELRAGEYFGFVLSLLLGAGLVFEVPVAMLAAARLGLVSARQFLRGWRVAIVVIALVAALLPGGDPLSMLLLMVPQIILYGAGVWLAATFGASPTTRWAGEPERPRAEVSHP